MLYPYIEKAGLLWMMPIISLSFLALALSLERTYYWLRHWLKSWGRKQQLRQIYTSPFRPQQALRICQKSDDLVLKLMAKFLHLQENVALPIATRKTNLIAEETVEESRTSLDILSLIANIAGTLGLMGTVVGISMSFQNLANEDPKGLAVSLSTAMYTTIGGIVLFLMSYVCLFFFQKFADRFEHALMSNLQHLKECLETEQKTKLIFEEQQKQTQTTKTTNNTPATGKVKNVSEASDKEKIPSSKKVSAQSGSSSSS